MALAAQAAHELRGPLSAALLAVDGLEPSARATAIELELRRAALAVDDLAAAPRGRRTPGRVSSFDLGELLAERRRRVGARWPATSRWSSRPRSASS